jgi:hypothetical protein
MFEQIPPPPPAQQASAAKWQKIRENKNLICRENENVESCYNEENFQRIQQSWKTIHLEFFLPLLTVFFPFQSSFFFRFSGLLSKWA